jgi:hypothetical protein
MASHSLSVRAFMNFGMSPLLVLLSVAKLRIDATRRVCD